MPTINSTGIGSGLDVGSLVSQLVAAERAPASGRLLRAEAGTNAKISALASFRGALSSLQTAAAALKTGGALVSRSAQSGDETVFKMTASANAAIGSHQVEVLSIATAHRLRSSGFLPSTSVGTGTLSIASGGSTMDVDIDLAHSTIADIRDAINVSAQAAGLGVVATVVTADDGQHLVLTAARTGASNEIRVTQSGGNGGLDALVHDPGTLTNLQEVQAASDASVMIDGLLRSSESNQVSDALDGVTLQLIRANPGQNHAASVGADDAAAKKAVQSFVSSYNAVVATMATITRFDPARREAAALNGDSLVRGVGSELRGILSNAVGVFGAESVSLVDLGIDSQIDGTLKIDTAKLEATMQTNPSAAISLFSASDGVASQFDAALDRLLDSTGSITERSRALNGRLEDLSDDRVSLEARMTRVEARYLAQFSALDSMIARLQGTSSFLSQQLSALPGAAK